MRKNAFTFVELLVVITIIAVIFAAGVVTYSSITIRSRDSRRKADVESIRQSLELCRSLTGVYPASILNTVTCTNGSVLMTKTPTDPRPCPIAAPVSVYTYSRSSTTAYTLSAPCMENEAVYQVTNP